MNILGISALFHDSAAALIRDGEIVAAAQEERFTRIKNDPSFPVNALHWCLDYGGVQASRLDAVVFYEKPALKADRLARTFLATAPSSLQGFLEAVPTWLREKSNVNTVIRHAVGNAFRGRVLFTEHHVSHAASAFYPSPFADAAILTVDGVGEWATTTIGVGNGNRIDLLRELRFPHSLGLLYSTFTHACGFRINSGEYKLMGLAPYGEPKYVRAIYDHLIDVAADGAFRINQEYFDYSRGMRMANERFFALFDGRPRAPDADLTRREMDLAASIQVVTEEVMLRLAQSAHNETGKRYLCMAGGVALNCVANGRLLREGPFERIWIQPAAGDAGGALGAALFAWYQTMDQPRLNSEPTQPREDSMRGAFLGPEFSDDQIRSLLEAAGGVADKLDDHALIDHAAELLADGKVVGWFQGRMEYGPRALGARSILADPRNPEMQKVMNLKIKFRESFRPFAPAVLREHASEWFETGCRCEEADGVSPKESVDAKGDYDDPYMLFITHVAPSHRLPVDDAMRGLAGFDKLRVPRSEYPAATHVDYSARVQTVDARHGLFRSLIERFYERTGCPVLLNTSFNVRGEPIVCSPEDAYRCFMRTDIDALVMGNYLLLKSRQPPVAQSEDIGRLGRDCAGMRRL